MNAMAVDMEVLSINPFWYRKERDLAAEIVAQLETAMKKQGLRGAAIGGSVAGADFSDRNSIPSGPRARNSARCSYRSLMTSECRTINWLSCAPRSRTASLPLGHWPCDRIKNIGAGMFKLDGTYSKGARFPASAPEGWDAGAFRAWG